MCLEIDYTVESRQGLRSEKESLDGECRRSVYQT
jgi:hypothetical protein